MSSNLDQYRLYWTGAIFFLISSLFVLREQTLRFLIHIFFAHMIQGLEDGKIRIVNIEDESPVNHDVLLSCH